MISYYQFKDVIINELQRDIHSNKDQNKAISSNKDQSLFLVAGPGSGKTTVMVLKILKFIFVDEISPKSIMATTFTKKAAKELHSRILEWGDVIKKHLLKNDNDFEIDYNKKEKINRVDFNQLTTGTIDSIAEELLRVYRDPGTNLPVVIEDFVANSAMTNAALFKNNRFSNKNLQKYLGEITGAEKVSNPSKMSDILIDVKNRIYYDQVDINELIANEKSEGAKESFNAIFDYIDELKSKNIIDFPMLESIFLRKLNLGKLDEFLNEIQIILVDEYQDTNILQENIYFTLAKAAIENGGSITVVGDDDQSLYRFRGATVDLFTNFPQRAEEKLNVKIKEVNLSDNYRSTEKIISLCNHFVEIDDNYQEARVNEKPAIKASRKELTIPIIGMFRKNQEVLARDLAILIKKLSSSGEVKLKIKKILNKNRDLNGDEKDSKYISLENRNFNSDGKDSKYISLKLDEKNGSLADIAILTYSPKELSFGNYLFPHYLRKNLIKLKPPIEVFNPRGQDLQTLSPIAIFCGLMLECIDPDGKYQKNIKKIPKLASRNIIIWRKKANDFIDNYPEPNYPMSLKDFVNAWKCRKPIGHDKWPDNASLIALAYKLITWINVLQDDVEGLVYFEAITKTITQTGFFNKFSAQINFDSDDLEKRSIEEAIWNIFIPIATGGVSIDENLLETVPKNRVNIMSIHQSKGLEFPLVIVDVGSRFNKNKVQTSFLRFPKDGGKSSSLEDKIRRYSSIGKGERTGKDRAFDDLIRLYFVAFSRAQDVLLLVGLDSAIEGYMFNDELKNIPNIALGWKRDKDFIGFDEIFLI
ncbi:MAG: DEAD/DEAH box helicase [Methanobacteriaceae archaeon]|jgi:DNA helicase-2/ATP-dependent DNA helicase PcrA|nr:DEAD/DEAH box helicase [Candidatus Methanorudis spinitermitis]